MASNGTNGSSENAPVRMRKSNDDLDNTGATSALARGLAALQESTAEGGMEEISKLDAQLDHLNDHLTKVGEKIDLHQAKLQKTLDEQREERNKRRQSFQERKVSNQQEDAAFQNQMQEMFDRLAAQRMQAELNAEQQQ